MEEKLTFEKVWAMFQETDRKFLASCEQADKEMQELRRIVKEVSQQLGETERAMKESSHETDRIVKNISQQLGGIGNSNGAAAEDYFYNSFNQNKKFGNEQFDYADCNVKFGIKAIRDEYDIVLYNGKSVGIIEVKYSAQKKDIAQTISKATTFRQLFPQYQDFTFYLGLAGFSFEKDVEKTALDAGIAVIKQVGENMVVLDERMKKF